MQQSRSLSRLYLGRFSDVHIGGPSSNQAASLESQMIHPIQLLPGRTLRNSNPEHRTLIDLRANLNRALKRSRYDIMNYR